MASGHRRDEAGEEIKQKESANDQLLAAAYPGDSNALIRQSDYQDNRRPRASMHRWEIARGMAE